MIATPDSWQRQPIVDPLPIPFTASFDEAEFQRIARGLVPEAMEDKWFVYYESPSLYFHRSWTGQGVFRVDFTHASDLVGVDTAVCAAALIETSSHRYQALILNFIIRNLLLGEDLPFPKPEGLREPKPGLFQHVVAGTDYREVAVKARREWWKLW